MSDPFYYLVRYLGLPAFRTSSRPTVLHADRLNRPGALLIAPNHLSPYDIPCLMASTRHPLDFVSIVEIFQNPLLARFLRGMNAFPLDRRRVDAAATRQILDRLARGRKVVIFPEGRIRRPDESLLTGADFNPSVLRLARLASTPILPAVILATGAYARPTAWLPFRQTRYAIAFGHPLDVPQTEDEPTTQAQSLTELRHAYNTLYTELRQASGLSVTDSPWRPQRA
jgi:1-acyl-sn-glycerol-3-phosphate acyltransferase